MCFCSTNRRLLCVHIDAVNRVNNSNECGGNNYHRKTICADVIITWNLLIHGTRVVGHGVNGNDKKGEIKMRRYEDGQNDHLAQVVCNKCGRKLKVENGFLKEGCFSADSVFGYFSRKDGITHHFDLCEDCYDEMISLFQVPVEETEGTELL